MAADHRGTRSRASDWPDPVEIPRAMDDPAYFQDRVMDKVEDHIPPEDVQAYPLAEFGAECLGLGK